MQAIPTKIDLIQTGIVRNLLRKPYFLRIPQDIYRKDLSGKQIIIPIGGQVEIEYRDWILIERELLIKDNLKVLKIMRFPLAAPNSSVTVINNYYGLPPDPTVGTVVWVQYGDYQGLYYYDTVRNEWLSENETIIMWSSSTDVNTHTVGLILNSDDTHPDNDTNNITPITVTAMAGSQANAVAAGSVTRFSLSTVNMTTSVKTDEVAYIDLSAGRGVSSTTTNFPIDGGVMISASRIKLSGSDPITRPSMTIWYRKRLVP